MALKPGEEFQNEVFELLVRRLKQIWPGAILSVTDNVKSGPIDVVAKVTRQADRFSLVDNIVNEIEELIYIECKDHADKIGLDFAGKAFCCAMIDMPNYLVIASRRGLSPQAIKAAHKLFNCQHATEIVLSEGLSRPISNIEFLHYTLDELKKSTGKKKPTKLKIEQRPRETTFKLLDWNLSEINPRYRIISRKEYNNSNFIWLFDHCTYTLDITLELQGNPLSDLEDISLYTLANAEKIKPVITNMTTDLSSYISFDLILNFENLRTISEEGSIEIHIDHPNGKTAIIIPIPYAKYIEEQKFLINVNQTLSNRIYNFILSSKNTSVLFVEGEAGVGKTTVIKNSISLHVETSSWVSIFISGTSSNGYRILSDIIDSLLDVLSDNDLTTKGILDAGIKSYLSKDISDSDRTRDFIMSPDFMLAQCRYLLQKINVPFTFVVTDCQALDNQSLKYLELVIQSDRESSASVVFVLEWRSRSGSAIKLKNLKSMIYEKPNLRRDSVIVPPLSEGDIYKALKDTVLDFDLPSLSKSMFLKTRGNPLFIDQILKHFVSNGYLKNIWTDCGHSQLLVMDRDGVSRELSDLDCEIVEFLKARLTKTLECSEISNEDTNFSNIKYFIWLLSISEIRLSKNDITATLDISESTLNNICLHLISEGVLSPDSTIDNIHFVHGLMKFAASNLDLVGRFQYVCNRLEKVLDSESPLACCFIGTALYSLKKYGCAAEWYNLGLNRLTEKNYYWERLILKGLDGSLTNIGYSCFSDKSRHLDVKSELGWSEFQSGSKIISREIYVKAFELTLFPFDPIDRVSRRNELVYQHKFLHMLVTVDVEIMNLKKAIENASLLVRKIQNKNLLFHVSNRILLISMLIDDVSSSIRLIDPCLDLAYSCDDDPNALSVVYSDIGSTFHCEYPEVSKLYWELGLKASNDKRQSLHSRANIFTSTLAVKKNIDLVSVNMIIDELRDLKLDSHLSRLYLLVGIQHYKNGCISEAEDMFSESLRQAAFSNHILMIWSAMHNLAIVWIKHGEKNMGLEYMMNLSGQLSDLKYQGDSIRDDLDTLCKELSRAVTRLEIPHQSQKLRMPQLSGAHTGPLWALKNSVDAILHYNSHGEVKKQPNSGHYMKIDDDVGFILI